MLKQGVEVTSTAPPVETVAGHLQALVLAVLRRTGGVPGPTLVRALRRRVGEGVALHPVDVHAALAELERGGLVRRVRAAVRGRTVYRITRSGRAALDEERLLLEAIARAREV
jgi:DNA-binding PadR family transcriptional regulator